MPLCTRRSAGVKICNDDHVAYTLCFFVVGGEGHRRHFLEHNDGDWLYSVGGAVLLRVAVELESEAGVDLSVLTVRGSASPSAKSAWPIDHTASSAVWDCTGLLVGVMSPVL